ncbi:transposase [Wolbachia endosymbiont (group B) of Limnophora tigrina]|uniref:transposase n=1 Tax=Wolbachia endosymbiont (group B) of Limnophora tigrina TaxID=3139317 RepID=UPI0035B53DE5
MESVGCKVLFLPPYSSDLNLIEKFWFAIKHAIKKALQAFGLISILLLILFFSIQVTLSWVSYRIIIYSFFSTSIVFSKTNDKRLKWYYQLKGVSLYIDALEV